jgi:hypothetical protein
LAFYGGVERDPLRRSRVGILGKQNSKPTLIGIETKVEKKSSRTCIRGGGMAH